MFDDLDQALTIALMFYLELLSTESVLETGGESMVRGRG